MTGGTNIKQTEDNRPCVFITEDEAKALNYDQIRDYLMQLAKRQGLEPNDLNKFSGQPHIHLAGLYEIDLNRQVKELTGKCFLMYGKETATRTSKKKTKI